MSTHLNYYDDVYAPDANDIGLGYMITPGGVNGYEWNPPLGSEELAKALHYRFPRGLNLEERMRLAIAQYTKDNTFGLSGNIGTGEVPSDQGGVASPSSPHPSTQEETSSLSPTSTLWTEMGSVLPVILESSSSASTTRHVGPRRRSRRGPKRTVCDVHRQNKKPCAWAGLNVTGQMPLTDCSNSSATPHLRSCSPRTTCQVAPVALAQGVGVVDDSQTITNAAAYGSGFVGHYSTPVNVHMGPHAHAPGEAAMQTWPGRVPAPNTSYDYCTPGSAPTSNPTFNHQWPLDVPGGQGYDAEDIGVDKFSPYDGASTSRCLGIVTKASKKSWRQRLSQVIKRGCQTS